MKSTYLDTSEAHLYYEVVGHGTPVLMLTETASPIMYSTPTSGICRKAIR